MTNILFVPCDSEGKVILTQEELTKLFEQFYNEGLEDGKNFKKTIDDEQTAAWALWGGWKGSHNKRIEDATCTNCGYKHPTVKGSLKELARYCPSCNSKILNVVYENGEKEKIRN